MMKKQNNNIKLAIFWVISFICIIFMMSLRVFASEPYFPMQQDDNDIVPQVVTSYMDYVFNSDENYVLAQLYQNDSTYLRFNVYVFSKESSGTICAELNNNGYQFSFYQVGSLTSPVNVSRYYNSLTFNKNSGSLTSATPNGNFFSKTTNIDSSLYNSTCAYVSNFKVYTTNVEETRQLVLNYNDGESDPINLGIAIIPPNALTPTYTSGDSAPVFVPPSYTVNNYTWTTAPQFDGSTVINGIQSIKDTLEWLSDNLHAEISNLANNIKGLADYIGKTIQYYGNMIVQTMNNLIQNLYDNMVALLEPIVQKLNEIAETVTEVADLFIHPFDEEEFEEQIESCELINQYNELMDNADAIREIFNNAEERDYFVLYIDFENPFADSEHKIIHSEISFTWLKDYRSIYRPFLWLFTMIECFVGGMRLLGGIIGGKAK